MIPSVPLVHVVLTYLHIMFYVYSIQVLYHCTKYVGKAFLASVQAWVIWMMLVLCIDTGCTKGGVWLDVM